MLSGDSMFPRIGDATQRAQLEARTLALLAAGIRTVWISHGRARDFAADPWRTVPGLEELLALLQQCRPDGVL